MPYDKLNTHRMQTTDPILRYRNSLTNAYHIHYQTPTTRFPSNTHNHKIRKIRYQDQAPTTRFPSNTHNHKIRKIRYQDQAPTTRFPSNTHNHKIRKIPQNTLPGTNHTFSF